jgi:ABC-type multidrug transport system fused ATPase/permease subunit
MIQRAIAAGRRVFEVLDAPDELPDAPGAQKVTEFGQSLDLNAVTFTYGAELSRDTGLRPVPEALNREATLISDDTARHGPEARVTGNLVLHRVSIRIPRGQTVALCGPSGSGKSTILNLLLRFYDPTQGSVTLDGIDLRSIQRESLRRHFALVQQESFLFNDSILDNIRYGHAEATMEQVRAACLAANAAEFIDKLPQGYDTIVGERGLRLSGGQKQRLSIARAFLANPQILLLDEPTSSVEPDSEAAIVAALGRLMAGRTTVLTSHRPSLIARADVVYVLDQGQVVDSGRPGEVRARNEWFARFLSAGDESTLFESNDPQLADPGR